MTRDELVEKLVASRPKDFPSKAAAERTVTEIFEIIKTEVAEGRDVAVAKFGTFYAFDKAATTAINPATKEKINVPAKRVPKFRAAEAFKKAVQ
jgi:DNA-binding protein HU-beta